MGREPSACRTRRRFGPAIPAAIKTGTLANFLDANRVTYKTGSLDKPLAPADQARAMSGFVACR